MNNGKVIRKLTKISHLQSSVLFCLQLDDQVKKEMEKQVKDDVNTDYKNNPTAATWYFMQAKVSCLALTFYLVSDFSPGENTYQV